MYERFYIFENFGEHKIDYIEVENGIITKIDYGGSIISREEDIRGKIADYDDFKELLYDCMESMANFSPNTFSIFYGTIKDDPLFELAKLVDEFTR